MKIGNKELIELFGSDEQKLTFNRTKKVTTNMKNCILNKVKCEYSIVNDLGRGKYEIDGKIEGGTLIPNSKIKNEIYSKLIPVILLNVLNYHENDVVFRLSTVSIYGRHNFINANNYVGIRDRKKTASEILDLDEVNIHSFFSHVDDSLKYYMENTLNTLQAMGLIRVNKLLYVKKVNHSIKIDGDDTVHSKKIEFGVRISAEVEQKIINIESLLDDKYGIVEKKDRYYSDKSKNYLKDRSLMLRDINIDKVYYCYEVLCLNKKEIINIVDFYKFKESNIPQLCKEFSDNFIKSVIKNATNRMYKKNTLFEDVGIKYVEDFAKLSNLTLIGESANINIPRYKCEFTEDDYGQYSHKVFKNN